MTTRVIVPLTKPIEAYGKQMTELALRKPTGRDLAASGHPIGMGSGNVDAQAVHALIGALAEIPPPSVDALDGRDWQSAMMVVIGFLAPPAAGGSTTIST